MSKEIDGFTGDIIREIDKEIKSLNEKRLSTTDKFDFALITSQVVGLNNAKIIVLNEQLKNQNYGK